jgi:hypothetical protein
MTTLSQRRRLMVRRIRITGWTALSALLVTIIGFLTWFHIVFPADREATLEVYRDDSVVVTPVDGAVIIESTSQESSQGLLYFPGARVDPFSYLHPFVDVAANGTTVVIVKPLFNMALFDTRSFEELTSSAPGVDQWVIAGHSLGGVKACMEADQPEVTALVLFASYCANDISRLDLTVLQVLGSNDGLIDLAASAAEASNLPVTHTTLTLSGANHASFGTYGPQPGDGLQTLTRADMRVAMNDVMATVLSSGD